MRVRRTISGAVSDLIVRIVPGVVRRTFIKYIASGFGLGFIPKAPGTFGTLLGIPLFWWFTYHQDLQSMLFIFFFVLGACIIAELAGPLFGEVDSQKIVIDEVAGFIVTVLWLPRTWQTVVLGFILFRFFDILKLGPIKYFERKLPGGIGVVMDDVLAGIFANIILQLIYAKTNWLGLQLV